MRGDLDAIVLKALARDRSARYPTVDAFIQDCERFLLGLPVQAQVPSSWYRLQKYVGRQLLGLGATTAAVVVAAGAGWSR